MSVTYTSYVEEVKKAIEDARDTALLAGAILVKGEAIDRAPVATVAGGSLRQSIDYDIDGEDSRAYVGSTSNYSVYVEKGTGIYAEDGNGRKTPWVYYDNKLDQYFYTKGMRKQPFLFPSIEAKQDEVIDIFEEELRKLGTS